MELISPGKVLRAELTLRESRLHLQLFRGRQALTEPSLIGIVVNKRDRSAGLVGLMLSTPTLVSKPLNRRFFAAQSVCRRVAATLTALGPNGAELLVDIRLFDDGLAYRYRLPGRGEPGGRCHVFYEESSVVVPDGATLWLQDSPVSMKNCEGVWENKKIGEVHADRSGPVVVALPNSSGYLALLEGENFGRDWSGSKYQVVGPRIRHVFSHDTDGFWIESANLTSPWRIVLAAPDLNGLVQAPLLSALMPDPDPVIFKDQSWVRPGRCAWSWWHDDRVDLETQKRFIDLASELGFEYNVVDGGWWNSMKPGQTQWDLLKEICDYGRKKNVAQWVWTAHEGTPDPANNWKQLRDELDRFKATGVVGLKIDFIDSESQAARRWYSAALRYAAERKLMLNFHGANVPSGEAQSWPNELSREGIYGLEQNKWGTIPSQHYAALPFTRFLTGHGDFTPGYFGHDSNRLKGTSWTLQLACGIAYTNGLIHWVGTPEDIGQALPKNSPERELFVSIPALWDDTQVLPGAQIGQIAPLLRKSGKLWFVGVIGGSSAQRFQLDTRFLGPGTYRVIEITDLPTRPDAWSVTVRTIRPGEALLAQLRPLGGYVARIERV
jgi:alpha-glucosidase